MFVTVYRDKHKATMKGECKMTDTNKNQELQEKGLSDEQLQKLIQSAEDKVRTKYVKEIKELEGKLAEFEEKTKEYEQKEKYYKTKDVLEKNNIPSSLAKYINIDIDNEEEIEELKKVFEQNNKDTGYKPEQNRTEDAYAKAKKEGDINGMLSNKLNKLFQ